MSAGPNRSIPGSSKSAGHHWGNYGAASSLPNVGDDDLDVRPGDLAAVGTELYICYSGVNQAAVWYRVNAGTEGGARIMAHPLALSVALAGQGTDAAAAAATDVDVTELVLENRMSVTGVGVLNGTVVGTDNVRVLIYDEDGTFVVGSATAGALSAGADVFQEVPLTAVTVLEPGKYWVGLKLNGTTAAHQRRGASGLGRLGGRVAGQTFAGNDSITVPSTYTADRAPICYLY